MQSKVKLLKVKIKSLAEEARIIRLEERRAISRKDAYILAELHAHRVSIVRREQRASYLAYAFLREIPYARCEPRAKTDPDWALVQRVALKFAGANWTQEKDKVLARFNNWRDDARAHRGKTLASQ